MWYKVLEDIPGLRSKKSTYDADIANVEWKSRGEDINAIQCGVCVTHMLHLPTQN